MNFGDKTKRYYFPLTHEHFTKSARVLIYQLPLKVRREDKLQDVLMGRLFSEVA